MDDGLIVAVTGGRNYADHRHVWDALDRLHAKSAIRLIVHGAASGADTLAAEWAAARGVEAQAFPVTRGDWDRLGRGAGPERNRRMLAWSKPDGLVAFPGGTGTRDCIAAAESRGIKVWRPTRYPVGT